MRARFSNVQFQWRDPLALTVPNHLLEAALDAGK
jgi:hypothetical protein